METSTSEASVAVRPNLPGEAIVGDEVGTNAGLALELAVDLTASDMGRIDELALSRVIAYVLTEVRPGSSKAFTWDDPQFWLVDESAEERSQFFAIGTALDFRFWRLSGGKVRTVGGSVGGHPLTGAMYMWRCLRRAANDARFSLLDSTFLSGLTARDFSDMFADDAGRNPLDIGASERVANLRDLGRRLSANWNGQFLNVVVAAGGSLVRFCELSREFRAFDDPLCKLTMLNVILHTGSGLTQFDRDPLPAIDYHLVKQMLRHGVVVPVAPLREKLVRRRYLTHGEASELRRLTLMAFLRIADATHVPGHILDNKWWGNRNKCLTEGPVCTAPSTASECPFLAVCGRLTDLGMPLERTRYY